MSFGHSIKEWSLKHIFLALSIGPKRCSQWESFPKYITVLYDTVKYLQVDRTSDAPSNQY